MISSALTFEAEERLEESVAAYRYSPLPCQVCNKSFRREAIGKLLSEVQGDPDLTRQAQVVFKLQGVFVKSFVFQVKRRIAQYISKAEQIGKVFLL